jgi:hypothetical protein
MELRRGEYYFLLQATPVASLWWLRFLVAIPRTITQRICDDQVCSATGSRGILRQTFGKLFASKLIDILSGAKCLSMAPSSGGPRFLVIFTFATDFGTHQPTGEESVGREFQTGLSTNFQSHLSRDCRLLQVVHALSPVFLHVNRTNVPY